MALSSNMSVAFENQRKKLYKKSFFEKLASQGPTQKLIASYVPSSTTTGPLLAWYKSQVPDLSKTAEAEVIRMGKKIHKTTLKQLNDKLYGVVDKNEQKNIINQYFEKAMDYRSDRIGTTETTRVKSFKTLAKATPTSYKKWVTMKDERVRKSHRLLGSKGWIPVTKAFAKGVYYPPHSPNCRCVLQIREDKPVEVSIKDTLGQLVNHLGGKLI